MGVRTPFAIAFTVFVLFFSYLGFADIQLSNDKFLHILAFFLLTTSFYWVIEAPRRRCINATLIVCAGLGGVGSEIAQGFLPYRQFDAKDILCNQIGSLTALLLSSFYHKRQLERRRLARYEQLRAGLSQTDADNDTSMELSNMEAQIETVDTSTDSIPQLQEVEPEPIK